MTNQLEETLRIEGGRVLATLVRLTGDIQLAEDALQDALVAALQRWPHGGFPPNPAAWLTTTARNRALDRLRREAKRSAKETEAMRLLDTSPLAPPDGRDDRLRLLFTSCHPSLSMEARVALTLRTIGGLTTNEIARAFLVSGPTMGQRISRAKKKIAAARIPYRVPEDHELPDRLPAVLEVLYLILTTGHHAASGLFDSRRELAVEAIRLSRLLVELMPDEDEAHGLLALALVTHSRVAARTKPGQPVVLLADQDRSLWDAGAIAEATAIVERRPHSATAGPYMLQAAIACTHGNAATFDETDWSQIADLYGLLEDRMPTPVVRVNKSVAVAQAEGPEAGLQVLEDVAGVEQWHLWHSTRASLLARLGRITESAEAYRAALSCEMNESDRRFLEQRLADLNGRAAVFAQGRRGSEAKRP